MKYFLIERTNKLITDIIECANELSMSEMFDTLIIQRGRYSPGPIGEAFAARKWVSPGYSLEVHYVDSPRMYNWISDVELARHDCYKEVPKFEVPTAAIVYWSKAGDGTQVRSLGRWSDIRNVHMLLRRIYELGVEEAQANIKHALGFPYESNR